MTKLKFCIVSPDLEERIDPPVFTILSHLGMVSYSACDVVIVPITRLNDYKFNKKLYDIKKPWVLVDFCEYGWDWDRLETHQWGKNSEAFSLTGNEWRSFDRFVWNNPPILTFKRELLEKDRTDNLIPIEYPCLYNIPPAESKEAFDSRPLDLIHYWGHSHEARVNLHCHMFLDQGMYNYYLVDKFENIEGAIQHESHRNIWASVYVPYFSRIDMNQVLTYNGMSKLSLSLPGAGVKCFRHSESPLNSIMVKQQDNLAWSYPWNGGENCINLHIPNTLAQIRGRYIHDELGNIYLETQRLGLYDIYLEGLKNIGNYHITTYRDNYIIPSIEKAL